MQLRECKDGPCFLAAYQYNIEYKCGKAHANADGLSRLPIEGSEELEDPVAMFQVSFVEELPVTATDIARETSRDTILAKVYDGRMATKGAGR